MDSLEAGGFVKLVVEAFRAPSEAPPGPVLLGLPQDVLTSRFVPAEVLADASPVAPTPYVPEIAEAVALIRAANNPVILVDDYLLRSPTAESDLAAFATPLCAPVLQVAYRRGPMLFQQVRAETVPTYVGRYDATDEYHRRMLGSADLLITLEDRNMYPLVVGHLPACGKLALTSNVAATVKNGYLRSSDVLVVDDVCRTMRRITDRLNELGHRRGHRACAAGGAAVYGRARRIPEPARPACCASAVELVRAIALGCGLVPGPVIVDDSQMFGGLVAGNYRHLPASVRVFGSHGGFVGGGLATAVGLATASPGSAVLATLGDQGFTNGLQALAAASERQAPLVVLVCNHGASVSLRTQADFDGLGEAGRGALGNVPHMSYAAIARGFGLSAAVHGWPDDTQRSERVAAASRELTAEVQRAITAGRTHVIELVTPSRPKFWVGMSRVAGLEKSASVALKAAGDGTDRAASR